VSCLFCDIVATSEHSSIVYEDDTILALCDIYPVNPGRELLSFLNDWLGATDHPQLASSLRRFVGTDGYDLEGLRIDLARFAFLLRHDDGALLFDQEQH